MNLTQGYEQLWKAIIRPPRAKYRDQMLGPKLMKWGENKIQRTDIQLTNKQGLKIKCSHYQPYIRPCKQLPCVIYLHGNSSCRIEGRSCIPHILCHDITLFTFDFAGCGNSEGEYISLGYYEKDDVDVVFKYLRSLGTVSSIGLWGRSMGAVTALMYSDTNHEIACIVCDSPFSNLEKLCQELADKYAKGFISLFSGIALKFIAKTIKQKNGLDISTLDPLGKHVKKAFIPAFFIAAKDDDFIAPKHTEKLYKAYSGEKIMKIVEGNHNSERELQVNEAISVFFYNNLHVEHLVKKDTKYMEQQKALKKKVKKQAQKEEQLQHYLQPQQSQQQKMLKQAIRLSLQQYQQSDNNKKKNTQITIEKISLSNKKVQQSKHQHNRNQQFGEQKNSNLKLTIEQQSLEQQQIGDHEVTIKNINSKMVKNYHKEQQP